MDASAPLANHVAVVTGASGGIGEAIARRLKRDGARVVLVARRVDRLAEISRDLGADATHVLALDVTDREALTKAFAALPPPFSEVSIVVNNAGAALGLAPAHEASLDDWEAMVDLNVKGVLYATRALLPGMVARDRGHVVNIGSVAGAYAYAGGNVYGATKAFVERFSQNLRADLFGKRVRVTNIEPGMVETDFSLVRFKGDAKRAAAVYANFEALTADDIADAVSWAVSRPAHVNVNQLEMMPVMQSFAGFSVARSPESDPSK